MEVIEEVKGEEDDPPPTTPVPPLPYRLGEFCWQPLTASYEVRIYFTKIGVRGKQTEHALGFLALKDHFSHPENPDFEPFCNLTELDYEAIGKIFIEAVNAAVSVAGAKDQTQ